MEGRTDGWMDGWMDGLDGVSILGLAGKMSRS